MEQQLYELPEGWGWKNLGQVCDFLNGYAFKSADYADEGHFLIRIGNVQDGLIVLDNPKYTAIPSGQERFSLNEGDLLMSLTGNVGRVGFVGKQHLPAALNQRVAKIDKFDPEQLIIDLLFAFFRAPLFLKEIYKHSHGAAQKNVSTKDIVVIKIPLPPLNEQKRIVVKLDVFFTRIDTAITRLQETIELSKALFASALDEMFSPERRQDEIVPLNKVAIVARGKSKHRPRNDKSLFGGDYPFIQTGDVRNARKYITTHSSTYNEKGLAQSKLWPRGTICLTIAANIGDVAILGMDSCFPDSVVGITSDSESNEYIYYFLMTLQRHLDSKANAAAQKNINLRILSEIEIPLPSVEEQNRIVSHLDAISERTRALEVATEEKLNDLTALKASLLDAAFKGQL